MKELTLTRKDLFKRDKDLPIEQIENYNFRTDPHDIDCASTVIFKDDDGSVKVIKNRDGETGIIMHK